MTSIRLQFVAQFVVVLLISAEISLLLYNILVPILPAVAVHIILLIVVGAFGVLLTRNLWRGVQLLDEGLRQLNSVNSAEPLPITRATFPFQPMLRQLNQLAGHGRDIDQLRGAFAQQIAEAAAQEERNRLARDLHDSIKQQIFSMKISAATAEARFHTDPAGAKSALTRLQRSATDAMDEMDNLLRQLRPAPIDRLGLVEAIREQCVALSLRSGAEVVFNSAELPEDDQFEIGSQEHIYRIIQEGLSNIARHARATHVKVDLKREMVEQLPYLSITIRDNGQGFDPSTVEAGMGLGNIAERAKQLGGKHEIASHKRGTTLRISQIPLLAAKQSESFVTLQTAKNRMQRLDMLHERWIIGWTVFSWFVVQLSWLGHFRTDEQEALLRFGVWGIGLLGGTLWTLIQTNGLQQQAANEIGTLPQTTHLIHAYLRKFQTLLGISLAFFGAFGVYWLAQLTITPWAYEFSFAIAGLVVGTVALLWAAMNWMGKIRYEVALYNALDDPDDQQRTLQDLRRNSMVSIVLVTIVIVSWAVLVPSIRSTGAGNAMGVRWFEWLNLTIVPTACYFWMLHLARALQLMRLESTDE